MSEYKVIGPFEIAGKPTGETVELDSNEVNIQALIDGGHIEEVERPKEIEQVEEFEEDDQAEETEQTAESDQGELNELETESYEQGNG